MRRLLSQLTALFLTISLFLPPQAWALRPSQPEAPEQAADLRDALLVSGKGPLTRTLSRLTGNPVSQPEPFLPYPVLLDRISRVGKPPSLPGLEEVIGKTISLITDEELREEAHLVLHHTLTLDGETSTLGPVPPLLKARLNALVAAAQTTPAQVDQFARELLVEWAAYRWAYQPNSPSGRYFDSLGSLLKTIVSPDQVEQLLQIAREIGVPTEAYPQSIAARKVGHITPMYSVRSEEDEGIGDMPATEKLIDWMAGQGMQQLYVMPVWDLDDLDPSPYLTRSAFAGNINFIGLRRVSEVTASADARQMYDTYIANTASKLRGQPKVDYPPVMRGKLDVLRSAYRYFRDNVLNKDEARTRAFNEFREKEAYWLNGYTSFMTIAGAEREGWKKWKNEDLKRRDPAAIDKWRREHTDEVQFYEYVQFVWDEQWKALLYRAHQKGIRIMGDMPHYVDGDAAWMFQEASDANGVSGAAVDVYSVVGQDFGSPTYDWAGQKGLGYPLHMARVRRYAGLFDDVRADYWVGYGTYFRIPATTDVAKWTGGNPNIPLRDLFQRLKSAWDAKYPGEPFPLTPVQNRAEFEQKIRQAIMDERLYPLPAAPTPNEPLFDRASFANGVVAVIRQQGRLVWGPNEPRYQSTGFILLDGTYADLRGMGTLTQRGWQQVTPTLSDANTREKLEREFLMKTDPEGRDRGDLEIWIHLIMRMLDAQYVDGPGHDFMQKFQKIVTFDHLGEVVPETFPEGAPAFDTATRIRYELALPRIRLLLYGMSNFYPGFWSTLEHPENSYGFTGTHDGPTLLGHILEMEQESRATREQLQRVEHVLGAELRVPSFQYPAGNLIARATAILDASLMKLTRSAADHMLVMYQDWMALDNSFRSTPPGNALGEKWRDRQPVTVEALLANAGEIAQATNARVQKVINDPQGKRTRTTFERTVEPRILKMRPLRGSEHGVRQKVIRVPGDKVQVWAEVVPSSVSNGEAEVQTTFWQVEEPDKPVNVPMRLYAVLPEGSRLFYAEFPAPSRIAEYVLTTQVRDPRSGQWLKATGPYEEPFLIVTAGLEEAKVQDNNSAPSAGLEERGRLMDSFRNYRSGLDVGLHPRTQFERSYAAAQMGIAVDQGSARFLSLFRTMADIVQDPANGIQANDVTRLFSHFLMYYPTTRGRVHDLLVHSAVYSEESSPAATRLAINVLLAMDVGEVVLASVESPYGSITGGQGTAVGDFAAALAQKGINVTVVTPMQADQKQAIMNKYNPRDTGKTVVVPYLNINHLYRVEVKIWEARVEQNVRVLYLEEPNFFRGLKAMYEAPQRDALRSARLMSLGTLLAVQAMNIHASVIQSNDGYTSFIPLYLNEGDDVDVGYVFRADERLSWTGTVHVIHTAAKGYQLLVHPMTIPPARAERDAKIWHDLGRDIDRRDLGLLVLPGNENIISALRAAIGSYTDYVIVPGDNYLTYTLDPANDEAIGWVHSLLDWKNKQGRYVAISNGFQQAERQKDYLGSSPLEMGHYPDRERLAQRVFSEIQPRQKAVLQEEFGLPQDMDKRNSFVYTLFGRIERMKGHQLLTTRLWSIWNPGVLQVEDSAEQRGFEGNPVVELSPADREVLVRYAQQEKERGHSRDYLTALEVALVLMPDLQVVVAGAPGEPVLPLQFARIADDVNTSEKKRFAYFPNAVRPLDPRHRALNVGSTVVGQPSEMESYGLVRREFEALGVPAHHSRRGGLKDGEVQVPDLASGFEPYHPVGWLLSLKHMYNVYKGNQPLWVRFKMAAFLSDNRWIRSVVDFRELYLKIRQERGYIAARSEVHLNVELPVFEVSAAINRALLESRDPANEIVREGYTLQQAADILLRGLRGTENETLASSIGRRYIPAAAKIPEIQNYIGVKLLEVLDAPASATPGTAARFQVAREAAFPAPKAGKEEQTMPAEADISAAVAAEKPAVVVRPAVQVQKFVGLFADGDPGRLAPVDVAGHLRTGSSVTYVVDVDPAAVPQIGRVFRQDGAVVPLFLRNQGFIPLPADLAAAQGTLARVLGEQAEPTDLALVAPQAVEAETARWDLLFRGYQLPGIQITPDALAGLEGLTPAALAVFLSAVRQTGGIVTIFGVEFEETTAGQQRLFIYA